jgi:hypothetical protein
MYGISIHGCGLNVNIRRVISVFIDAKIKKLSIKREDYH